jgi:hypothetical protein
MPQARKPQFRFYCWVGNRRNTAQEFSNKYFRTDDPWMAFIWTMRTTMMYRDWDWSIHYGFV